MDFELKPGEKYTFQVEEAEEGTRLDQWLTHRLGDSSSRAAVQKWIREGCVHTGTSGIRGSTKVREGEVYTLEIPPEKESVIEPVELDFRVLYEDDSLAVIVKPPGVAVHPGPGEQRTTLINGILHRFGPLEAGERHRPGLVHRLDRDTEGLMLIAKNEVALRKLSAQFENREVSKEYCAWLLAAPAEPEGEVNQPLARNRVERTKMKIDPRGRDAVTLYKVEKSIRSRKGRKYSFATIRILTGRTHQIRVHMAHLGAPVVGDPYYSRSAKEFSRYGLLLLAKKLEFRHPRTDREFSFELELPARFLEFEKNCIYY